MSNIHTLYDEANQLKDAGELDNAATKLREAIGLDSSFALAYSALAVVEQKRGNHDEAIASAEKVCELEPDDPFSYTAMSVTYQRAYAGTNNMEFIQKAEEAMERSRQLQMGM